MASGQLTNVIDHLRRTALLRDHSGMTDGELLGAFLDRQDPAAFEMLVRRHGGMVHGVCRRMLGNPDDADDAFQATFLVLVRRAASVAPREKVGNWLYGVAYRTALKAKGLLARRRAKEKQVSEMPHPSVESEQARHELRQLLDQELSQLPEKYRLPVVLCDLEGRTRREVARQLRLPEGTLSNRLAAARQRLAGRLKRRGLALSSGTVATLLAQEASAGIPTALVAATVRAATQVAVAPAALAAAIPPHIASLTQGVLQTMWITRLKWTVVLMLTLGALGTGAGALLYPTRQPSTLAAATREPAPAAKPPSPDAQKKARARSQEILRDALKEFNAAEDEPGALPHRLLADMAVLQARLGDRAAAKKLFTQAGEIIEAATNGQAGEWRMLAGAEAKAGEVEAALATARRIPEGDQYRDIALQEVATALAKNRREQDALRVGDLIDDAEKKTWVRPMLLEKFALAHVQAGDVPAALRVMEQMKEPAAKVNVLAGEIYFNLSFIDYPHQPGIALIQAKAGDKAGAEKTLRRAAELAATITGAIPKARALTAVACAQARMGDVAAARKTAEGIPRKEGKMVLLATARMIALAAIARAQAKAGNAKEALAGLDRLPDTATKVHVLTHLGAGQAWAGDQAGAEESFRRAHVLIGSLAENDHHLHAHNLAAAQANAGDYKGAMETAEAFLPAGSLGYVNIAFARAEAGDYTGALKMAAGLKDSAWWKGNLLRGTAKLQTERGQEKAALTWIGRLSSPLARANALLGVAEGLVK